MSPVLKIKKKIEHRTGLGITICALFVQIGDADYDEYDAEAGEGNEVGPAGVAAIHEAEDEQATDKASGMGRVLLSAAAVSPGNGPHLPCACAVSYSGTQASLLFSKHVLCAHRMYRASLHAGPCCIQCSVASMSS